MDTGTIIDIVILAIVIISIVAGAVRGLFKTVIAIVVTIAAIVGSVDIIDQRVVLKVRFREDGLANVYIDGIHTDGSTVIIMTGTPDGADLFQTLGIGIESHQTGDSALNNTLINDIRLLNTGLRHSLINVIDHDGNITVFVFLGLHPGTVDIILNQTIVILFGFSFDLRQFI